MFQIHKKFVTVNGCYQFMLTEIALRMGVCLADHAGDGALALCARNQTRLRKDDEGMQMFPTNR